MNKLEQEIAQLTKQQQQLKKQISQTIRNTIEVEVQTARLKQILGIKNDE